MEGNRISSCLPTFHSRFNDVGLQHGLDRQVPSLGMLAEVLLGTELVFQGGSKIPHVLAGSGLRRKGLRDGRLQSTQEEQDRSFGRL